ncbi:MAG: alpha/beta hydrolase-fold protein [Butyrivibrio sp.]|nr:alpha/beta hydrolase-fold protein [Butyrivibrio sp.]
MTDGKSISVYPSAAPDMPMIYLNCFSEEGDQLYQLLQNAGCADFTLVVISRLAWNHDMAPWDIPPISRDDTPCTGGADAYLELLVNEIVPMAERFVSGKPAWRGLAGYSLAGLFAVYALYRTNIFSRIGSMSGSLWFPNFREYVLEHEMARRPEAIYFSLGDKECRTRNPYLKTVQDNTEAISDFYSKAGIDTVFRLNHGGHFTDTDGRTAAGLAWLLDWGVKAFSDQPLL